ncbi:dynein heavy chain domain-containing protein 1-like [Huso huso]|uniref:Dynein heavy chain domain-containing protein 1-like n=1 Tax=Huso huso TaxID=61971 RepID=A0ABR0ZLU5_HUSHU
MCFHRWHTNVRHLCLLKRCDYLQRLHLLAVPQFGAALLQFSRLIEELKRVHWLPLDDSQSYTLIQFQGALYRKNREARGRLEKFLQYRTIILNMVQDDSYKVFQDLQTQLEKAKSGFGTQSISLQHTQQIEIDKSLQEAKSILQRLGNMASLADHMIVQNLVTIVQREVTIFIKKVMQAGQLDRRSLFQAHFVFDSDSQLTLFPSAHLFADTLLGALKSVADSALQVFDCFSNTSDNQDTETENKPAGNWSSPRWDTGFKGLGDTDSELSDIMVPKFVSHLHSKVSKEPRLVFSQLGAAALREVQEFCESHCWLAEIHQFICLWSPDSLDAMQGWRANQYDDRIMQIKAWTEKLMTVEQSFTTSNKLFTVDCSVLQEEIVRMLDSIDTDILRFLTSGVEQRAESWILELKRAIESLSITTSDIEAFGHYTNMVEHYQNMAADLHQQLEYVRSLHERIRMNYRQLSGGEEAMEEQMLDLWDSFVPLLRVAAETVSSQLPSMVAFLDATFNTLSQELQDVVFLATSGKFLDTSQSSAGMLGELRAMSRQFHSLAGQLYGLTRTKQSLKGKPLDVSFIPSAGRKLDTRKAVWELLHISKQKINDWKQLPFHKFNVAHALEKVNEGLLMATQLSLSLPVDDGVLRQTRDLIESFSQYLPLLGKLSSPVFKQKHWRILFRGMELVYEPVSNMSVSDLLSKNLLEHQDLIIETWQEGKAEFDMEQVFRKLQRRWEGEEFRLANFILTEIHKDLPPDRSKRPPSGKFRQPEQGRRSRDTGTFTIIGSEDLRTLIEDCVMTLSIMTSSPYISEFRQEVENWEQLLQQLEELLYLWERFQLKWVFLNRVFYEMEVGVEKPELLCRFKLVDESYKSLIEDIAYDPLVMSIVKPRLGTETRERVRGEQLREVLKEGLGTLEEISDHLRYLFDSSRAEFPRLYFLSDGELIQLLSAHVSPPSLLPLVRKCFPSVQELQLGSHTKRPQNRARLELYSVKFYVMSQELWESGLHSDQRVIRNIIDLYHALQLTRAVILIGPAGSGKTTSYRSLAGALRRLAGRTEEMDCKEEASNKMDGLVSGQPTWTSVDTAIIFPSSLSIEEFFGVFHSQGSWLDGAFTKILKDSEKRDSVTKDLKQKPRVSKEKWVVLDGESLAEAWLDPISTLLDTENPFLSLPSGEQVRPSRERLKIVLEVTELDGASPSVITQCGLVYHTEKDVWRTIWKAAVEALTQEYNLDQRTKSLWSTLADDLFAPTLAFLRCSSCSPVLIEGTAAKQDKTVAYGVQEVTSFNRILQAFLEQCNSEKGKGKRLRLGHIAIKGNEAQSLYADDSSTHSSQHLLAINMFVVSYIWGFGGHLHPR